MKKSYYYPLYYFSSTEEVIIYILATRYGLSTYIFAKRPNMETLDTVIRYTFFPLKRRKK
jgi:acyl-CoA reductase-like NAD-dependent aldehyde dehydrogenase